MLKRLLLTAIVGLFIIQTSFAQDMESRIAKRQKWFWPLIAASSVMFISGITLFAIADDLEDRATDINDLDESDDLLNRANIYWTLAVFSLGGSSASGITALRFKYEPTIGFSSRSVKGGTVALAWDWRF